MFRKDLLPRELSFSVLFSRLRKHFAKKLHE